MVARSDLPDARRAEVLEEMIAHFEDGLAAGRPAAQLLVEFGEADLAPTPAAAAPFPLPRVGDRFVHRFLRDLRYAMRRLVASPGFTLIAVLSLALGIGATTAVFGLINAIILRRSPIRAVNEVVNIYESKTDFPFNAFSYPDYKDFERATTQVFSQVAATRYSFAQAMKDGMPTRAVGELVTGNDFPLLGIRPAARTAARARRRRISRWAPGSGGEQRVLETGTGRPTDGDRDVVAAQWTGLTVVGVMTPEYAGNVRGLAPDFYASMMMVNQLNPGNTDDLQARGNHGLFVRARLRPGVTLAAASGAAAAVAAQLKQVLPAEWRGSDTFTLIPTQSVIFIPSWTGCCIPPRGFSSRSWAWSCWSFAPTSRAFSWPGRRPSQGDRGAASRWGPPGPAGTQLLTETLLLGALGGIGGLGFAAAIGRVLTTANLPLPIPITLELGLDLRAFSLRPPSRSAPGFSSD